MICFLIDVGGDIGPFQLAIGLTIVSLLLIIAWDENYGDAHETPGTPYSLVDSVTSSFSLIAKYPAVLCLGLSQAFFEGAVYTFGKYHVLLNRIRKSKCSNHHKNSFIASVHVGSIHAGAYARWFIIAHRISVCMFHVIHDFGWDDLCPRAASISWWLLIPDGFGICRFCRLYDCSYL